MPNWVRGEYAIKGTTKNVLNFLNEGLLNSGCEPMDDCQQAFDCLKKNAKTMTSDLDLINKKRLGTKVTEPAVLVFDDELSFDTFRPMPATFRLYDTTNCAKTLPTVAREQMQLYGCVGWYNWGLQYRGTKWNEELENFALKIEDDIATITFGCSTAWSYPYAWLEWVMQTFDVQVLLCVSEESNLFNFYGVLGGDEISPLDDEEGKPSEGDYEKHDDYYEALFAWQDDRIGTMFDDFHGYVDNYQVA